MYGSKIATIRLARGYSQEYVAEKIGIKQNMYSRIEKDDKVKVGDELLKKISDALGVSVEDIKSPTPVIMNFHNSSYNAPFGTNNNNLSDKVLEQLIAQLAVKDKYIEQLIAKIK